jgi:hypothetical protein
MIFIQKFLHSRLFSNSPISNVSPPLISPKVFNPITPGDLVEFFPFDDSHQQQLGIIRRIVSNGGSKYFQVFTQADSSAITRPYSIRFRLSKYVNINEGDEDCGEEKFIDNLGEFEKNSLQEYNSRLNDFRAYIHTKMHYPGMGHDRLIYLEDFTNELFCTSNPTVYQQYAAHYFLSRKEGIGRDIFNLQNNTYYILPENVTNIMKKALEIATENPKRIRHLHAKIMAGGIYQLGEEDQILLDFCLIYSLSNQFDNSKPKNLIHLRIVRSILGSVKNESEAFQRLITLPCFTLPSSPTLFQAGALQDEARTFEKLNFKVEEDLIRAKPIEFFNPIYTIDDPETVEVDDGVSIEGEDTLCVHIADPCRIIGKDSKLESIARKRVTNVYLPEKIFPMVPWNIAKTASLDPGEPRRALTFTIKLKENGDLDLFSVKPSILHNVQRLSYKQVDDILEGKEKHSAANVLKNLLKLAQIHKGYRIKQGHVLIEVPRSKVRVIDGQIKIKMEENETNSRLLVSECMVMTGRVAAEILIQHKLPGPFRFHRQPEVDLPLKFTQPVGMGNQTESGEIPAFKENLSEVFELLEKMHPAEVDIFPKRHWAMGLDAYVKATSPLRRYLDLVTHRQLYSIFEGNRRKSYSQTDLSIMIPPIYRHELYVKKLQRQATRFWINMYLSKLLSKEKVILEGTVLDIDQVSGITSVFLDFPALLTYQARIVNVSELRKGTLGRFKLIEINVLRGFVKLFYMK